MSLNSLLSSARHKTFRGSYLVGAGVLLLVGIAILQWESALRIDAKCSWLAPTWIHPLGCDGLGRDVLARILQGTLLSLSIGGAAVLIDLCLGLLVAALCLVGPRIDLSIRSTLDIAYGLPYFVIAAVISAWTSSSWAGTLIALVCIGWIPAARLLRGVLLSHIAHESILTVRQLGITRFRLFTQYLWPALRIPLGTHLSAAVPQAILAESLLSYLGLGVRPPIASLGVLCQEGLVQAWESPWLALAPMSVLIFLQTGLLMASEGKQSVLAPEILTSQKIGAIR
jgi:oligopeptide transport system permease protein